MRSIRRSLLGYLLVLLAIALSGVGLLVDRFANAAVRAREASEAGRIEQAYKLREQEAKAKFDADLLAETKVLAKEVHLKTAVLLGQSLERRGPRFPDPQAPAKAPDEEAKRYRIRTALLGLAGPPFVAPTVFTVVAVEPRIPDPKEALNPRERRNVYNDPRRYTPFPLWSDYDVPRAITRLKAAMRRSFEDDDHPGYFQFTIAARYHNRPYQAVADAPSAKLAKLGANLPFDADRLLPAAEIEPKLDDVEVPGQGLFRRVVTGAGERGQPILLWLVLPAPAAPIKPAPDGYPTYPPFRGPDATLRIFVHHARPYSELEARLAADREARDEQLASVRAETGTELTRLRARLVFIGGGTFIALVFGGWFFVARGLSPLVKLSAAVSQVSEKDFRLPVLPEELGRELVPVHARLTQTLTLLQRAFAREKQAVADISHELRTPIASLMATIDVALRKPRTPEQYREALEECRLISKQLGQLVERIMTLASLDAGNDRTQLARTDAADLAAGCAAVIRPLAAAHDVTVSARLADELYVMTDAGKLREVLMNLLHNAVEYNKPGGTIELIARRDADQAVFEVRDTGIGMTPEIRERIFERFYRADSSRTATGVHAGLGLAIVKEYVTRLGGTISLETESGVGTTFRVSLPTAPEPAPVSTDRIKPARDARVPAGS